MIFYSSKEGQKRLLRQHQPPELKRTQRLHWANVSIITVFSGGKIVICCSSRERGHLPRPRGASYCGLFKERAGMEVSVCYER